MSVDTMVHPCTCLIKAPLFVDGDTDAVYHETCEGFIGDICDMALNDKFWNDQLTSRENALVINGNHYRLGSATVSRDSNGMGGDFHRIKFLDTGNTVDTVDLWHQGTVPEEYKGILQDNAKFVRMIKVSEFLQCPNCGTIQNRDTCYKTTCPNTPFEYGESIEVKNV